MLYYSLTELTVQLLSEWMLFPAIIQQIVDDLFAVLWRGMLNSTDGRSETTVR